MPRIRLLALLILLPVLASPAHAEEGKDPVTAYAARAAALPPPSKDRAFAIDCDLVAGGQTFGRATFSAQPLENEVEGETFGEAGAGEFWEIRETMVLAGGSFRRKLVTYLDAHLEPQRGIVEGMNPERGAFHVTWHRTDTGFRLEHTTGEGASKTVREETLVREGPILSTITGLWLFCRLTLNRPGSFEVTLFDADPAAGETNFEHGRWTIPEVGTWKGVPAFVVTGTKSKGTAATNTAIETAFDATTRAWLGSSFRSQGQPTMEFRLHAPDEPAKAKGLPYTPATTAKDAAMQGALALAVGDVDLLDKTIHWPTFHARAKAQYDAAQAGMEAPEPFATEEAFHAKVLADLRKSLGQRPVAMIKMALKMAESGLKEEELDGFTRVKFPDVFRGLEVDVAAIDDVFYLVRLPGKPN